MIKKHFHLSLLPYNTFGIDVLAEAFVEYTSVEDLKCLLADTALPTPFLHIGGGSNLLFISDFKGTVFHSAIKGIKIVSETEKEVFVRVGAGEVWDDFVAFAVDNDWYGAENLSLVPGEVGASAVQNIGAYGVEAKDLIACVETVEVESGSERSFSNDECHFSYRNSNFKGELKGKYVVTYVTYKLSKRACFNLEYGNICAELEGQNINLSAIRQAIIRIRQAKLPDPKEQGNAGSFFTNPVISRRQYEELRGKFQDIPHYDVDEKYVKVPAAWMIDRCGWKGYTTGSVGVHDKQALVLVNKGGATGTEVVRLAHAIQQSVFERFGVSIYPEVNFIGQE